MDKEDLKKSTCINLRCVTQSSKDGVPLNQLQNDYRQLLGTPIPFKELGYSSLENFLRNIPDVICLKKKPDGSLIAEGVADASTAHIAKLISKQKPSKKSKSGSTKRAVVTRTWGSTAKKNSHQNLKSSLKDFNSFPPSNPDGEHAQNSKFIPITPEQQELKKSVLINLRSVVQSSKDGVPLNRLQSDYCKFIGSSIPFQNLGYRTLYKFIQNIPDVIKLKKDVNDQLIAIGVVDAATAHLFDNPLKPKPLKSVSPPTEPSKPSVNNKATLQISSQQKTESPSFFKLPQNIELSDLNSVLKHSPANKKVRKKNQVVSSVSEVLSANKEKCASAKELIKSEDLKASKPITNCKKELAPEMSLSKTDSTSAQNQNKSTKSNNQNLPSTSAFQTANTISTAGQIKIKPNSVSASENSVEKEKPLNSFCNSNSEANIQLAFNTLVQSEKRVNCIISGKSSDQDESSKSSKSSVAGSEDIKPSFKKNPVTLKSEKADKEARRKAIEVQNQIKIASLSPLVWMHFVLYGPSKMETLRKKVLSFYGFPFSIDSAEWKGKINLLSQLPKKALQHCMYLLCIEYNPKDTKKSLRDKLINFLAAYTEESGTNTQETEQEDNEKELYASTLTLSSVSSDVVPRCSSYADAVLNGKNVDASRTKYKVVSDSDSGYIDLSSCHLPETKEPVQVQQLKDKGGLHTESCKSIQSETIYKTKYYTSTKSALQKPSASDKVTSVLEKQQPLDKKVDVEERPKTETSSAVSSKSAKRKRKKSEIPEKNIGLSVGATKPVKTWKTWRQLQKMKRLKKEKCKRKSLLSSAVEAKIAA